VRLYRNNWRNTDVEPVSRHIINHRAAFSLIILRNISAESVESSSMSRIRKSAFDLTVSGGFRGSPRLSTTTAGALLEKAKPPQSVVQQTLTWYSHQLDTYPLLTKAITSGVVAGVGDGICQYIVASREGNEDTEWNALRTGRFAVLGLGLTAPIAHYWFGYLAKALPGSHAAAVAKRVALDQVVYSPLLNIAWLSSMWTLESFSEPTKVATSESIDYASRLRNTLPGIIAASWTYWTPVIALNFRFVPVKYQVLYTNMAALVWTVYLSHATTSTDEEN